MADTDNSEPLCDARTAPGQRCDRKASHTWSRARFCCEHFDSFVNSMLELKDALLTRHHADIVRALEATAGKAPKPEGGDK